MLAYLKGTILAKGEKSVILEVGGVGYEVLLGPRRQEHLPVGSEVEFYLVHVVREDASDLFGVPTREHRQVFEWMTAISGVGPRTALHLLDAMDLEEFKSVIAKKDLERLVEVPGVGRKTAERIVLELRSKMEELGTGSIVISGGHTEDQDVLSALQSLGYSSKEIRAVLPAIPPEEETIEEKIKAALRLMGRRRS
jgi:Holliday junction DNA helicase RuvA